MVDVPDVTGLPRVLLLGDSVSMGYTLPVRKKLQGIANVHRPAANCCDTTNGLRQLDKWLGNTHWDVIHFNFGLHDLKYHDANGKLVAPDKGQQTVPPEQYRKQLREITVRLQATGAKLIFATTTPVPPGTEGRIAGSEKTYNDIARSVMAELGVPVDDLWAYVVEEQKKNPSGPKAIQFPANVHFNWQGCDQLADQVAASIKKQLPPGKN